MEIHMYGIPNCDTVKKAQQWLAKNNLQFVFHDYKKEGVTKTKLNGWCKAAGWQTVCNLRSSTWQALAKEGTTPPATQAEAVALMQEHHSII
ncbi:MAG: arsenate reductase, partial [Chitinophagaceae bacterium]